MSRYFAIAAVAILLPVLSGCDKGDRYIAISGYAQGGTYTVKLNLNGKDGKVKVAPQMIKSTIDSLLNVIDFTLSGYNKASEMSKFNKGEEIEPNEMFKDIYAKAYAFWEETEGALDVAAGPLFDIWGFGFTTDSLPAPEKVEAVRLSCGMKNLEPTLEKTMELSDTTLHPQLNFNAIAQGYSCDIVASYLHSIGVKDMLVDIGEIFCEGKNPSGKGWSVAIDRPIDGNNIPGADIDGIWRSDGSPCGIVTSGNYRKYYISDGKKYSHTIDPRTGYPVSHSLLSATIVAPDATDADAYATYCMVIGLEEAKKFISSRPEIEGYLIYEKDGQMAEWASEGFNLVKE